MNETNNKFRVEIKYFVNPNNFLNLNEYLLTNFKFQEIYKQRKINSVYFDTHDLKFISDNLSGSSLRKKFRLRWYNNDQTNIFAEVKIKKNIANTKIRKKIPLDEISKINNDLYKSKILLKYFSEEKLFPKIEISYLRNYFYYKGIIITVDKELTFTSILNKQNQKKINYNIIELKFPYNDLKKFNQINLKLPFRVSRNSKYVLGMSALNHARYI